MIRRPTRTRVAAGLALLLLLLALATYVVPLRPPPFPSHPRPVRGYDEALAVLAALGNDDTCAVAAECRTEVMTHGARTGRVVVLFHGLTNCPAQFRLLGRQLYGRGVNVVIPLIPHHGCADHMTTALAHLDARELTAFTDRVVDAAHGLGDSVTVAGLSLGGTLAAWAAAERADVDRAVVIAPMFGLALARGSFTRVVARAYRHLPNQFTWWNPKLRENLPGPRHVYPRWAWRSIGETLWLGAAVCAEARRARPAARSIGVITVGGDIAVDNRAVARAVAAWRAHGAHVDAYEFPERLHVRHDLIDPDQRWANTPLVYPRVIGMILVPGTDGAAPPVATR